MGVAVNTPLGAFSSMPPIGAPKYRYGDGVVSGRNLGISYNKNLPAGDQFRAGCLPFLHAGLL